MLVKTVFLALTLSAMGLAQEIDNGDIPRQCSAICAPIVTLARDCDRQNNDNDRGERDCICNAQGASTQLPACEACVTAFDNDDDNPSDNDVNDLLRSCNFSTTTYNPSATQQASASASASGSGSAANNNSSARPTASGSNAPNSSPTGGSNNNAATGGSVQQSQNAAPAPTMMAGAGVLAGVAGLAAFL